MMWIQAKMMVKVGDIVECNNGIHYRITKKRFKSCDMQVAASDEPHLHYTDVAYKHIKEKMK